jgi:hypothetical protein
MILGVDFFEIVDSDMGIYLGGFQGFMTEHFLYMPDGRAVSEHVGGTSVSQGVGGDVLLDIGKPHTTLDHGPYAVGIHPLTPPVQDEKAGIFMIDERRPNSQDIVSYKLTNSLAQGDDPVLIPLSLDADIAGIEVKV